MPITVTCKSCGRRYQVVDTAAGRRVKCRTCASAFYVPGDPRNIAPAISPQAMAELEQNARPAMSDRDALLRYQATVSMLPPEAKMAPPEKPKPGLGQKLATLFKKK